MEYGFISRLVKYNLIYRYCNFFIFRNFYIVEFNDGVTVVPHNWLLSDNTKCSFPPGNNNKIFYKSVADMVKPKDN